MIRRVVVVVLLGTSVATAQPEPPEQPATPATGEVVRVVGRVIDALGRPVRNAAVGIEGPARAGSTDRVKTAGTAAGDVGKAV
ncbi:MAG: hypothetical protein WKG01_15560, partial [Kofleriaceae bacterium]